MCGLVTSTLTRATPIVATLRTRAPAAAGDSWFYSRVGARPQPAIFVVLQKLEMSDYKSRLHTRIPMSETFVDKINIVATGQDKVDNLKAEILNGSYKNYNDLTEGNTNLILPYCATQLDEKYSIIYVIKDKKKVDIIASSTRDLVFVDIVEGNFLGIASA